MKKIGIIGTDGRMGKLLLEEIAKQDFFISGPGFSPLKQDDEELKEVFKQNDYIVDFSHPNFTSKLVSMAKKIPKPLIICTTGWNKEVLEEDIKEIAKLVPVVIAPNTSIGALLQQVLAETLAKFLDEEFDIDIHEKHHHNKVDFPSGTALNLANSVNSVKPDYKINYSIEGKRESKLINISGQRSGNIFGEHEVSFTSESESIIIKHTAFSRNIFAKGAIKIVKWLAKNNPEKGIYSTKDILV